MNVTEKNSSTASAAHVIAGFRYQLLHSVIAWLGLRGKERLLLEVREDFTVEGEADGTDYQVKGSQAARGPTPFSLQTPAVREVLERFWNASNAGQGRRLVFMARGGAAREKDYKFPEDVPGLTYWAKAALDADTSPLRETLKGILPHTAIGQWLDSAPSDQELRERLLRRVSWQLDQKPADALFAQVEQQVKDYYYVRGWVVSLASTAAKALIALTMEVASRSQEELRSLSPVDLALALEQVAKPAELAQATATVAVVDRTPGHDILVSEVEAPIGVANRRELVEEISKKVAGQTLVWVHGAHGVGKSTLARLLAAEHGGRWVAADLCSVQKDQSATLSVWGELLRTITQGDEPRGVIVDDLDGTAPTTLKNLVVALVQSLAARGARIIVTSHHQPSPVRIAECGGTPDAIVAAPYFSEGDITEFISQDPAPNAGMIRGWSMMLYLSTGGGHPLLLSAKVASLRARGWPRDALLEDFAGATSEPVQLTRDEQRRRLLDDLKELDAARSLDAGQLLRRVACVFDRANEPLIRKLILSEPALSSGTDALAALKGSWLENLTKGDFRVSPLLSDIVADIPPEEAKRWRQVAAEYWLSTRSLNERTLPLCFWNAFLGQHDWVLAKVVELIVSLEKEQLRSVASILSPLATFKTDTSIYESNKFVGVLIRLLQFEIADALGQNDASAKVAERLLVEMDELSDQTTMALLTTMTATKVLTSTETRISPKQRLDFALRLRAEAARSAELFGDRVPDRDRYLPPWYGPDLDMSDFLFSMIVQHTKTASDVLETIRALDVLPPETRNSFLDGIDATYSGIGVFVNAGWANEQNDEGISAEALGLYEQAERVISNWHRPDMEIEFICARSVIFDERLNNQADATRIVDEAVKKFGRLPQLLRQLAKVAAHRDDYQTATDLTLEVENSIGAGSPLDRALALRDAGVWAAKAGRLVEAVRLLDTAHSTCSTIEGQEALATGIIVEKGLALWHNGQRSDAVLAAADALDAVGKFSATASRQAERSHMFARALVGLFFDEIGPRGLMEPPFTFGAASSLELSSAKLLGANLRPIPDNYRILAAVEASLRVDLGIDARSLAVSDGTLNIGVETGIALNTFEAALRAFDIPVAVKASAQITAMGNMRVTQDLGDRMPLADLEKVRSPLNALDDSYIPVAQSGMIDIILAGVFADREPAEFLPLLEREVVANYGRLPELEAVIKSASGRYAVGSASPFFVIAAQAIVGGEDSLRKSPLARLHRDLMMLSHLLHSVARNDLAPVAATRVYSGWRWVWDNQRFLLKASVTSEAEIEAALEQAAQGKLSGAAALLVSISNLVDHKYADGWFAALQPLVNGKL